MTFTFNATSDIHIEIAEDLLECIQAKSKWAIGAWTWVSLTNIKVYYDTKMVHTYNGHYYPDRINLIHFLTHLEDLGIVEKNQEIFLRDQFFRLTKEGRRVLGLPGDLYKLLSKHSGS